MGFTKCEYIWMNGELVKWDDAKIHVLSHVVHYGSSVFEGMRVYKTEAGPAAFRLDDHTRRLFNSAKIYRMEIPFTIEQINDASNRLERMKMLHPVWKPSPKARMGLAGLGR